MTTEPIDGANQAWVTSTLAAIKESNDLLAVAIQEFATRPYVPAPADTVLQAVGDVMMLSYPNQADLTSFSFHLLGFTVGTFVVERTLHADPTTAPAGAWTIVGAFKAGTRKSAGTWVDSPGAYHGNCSASTGLRVRVTAALNAPAEGRMIVGAGVGTTTTGAMANNPDNIIGAIMDLAEHYATVHGGRCVFNASTQVMTITAATTEKTCAALVNPAGSGVDIFIDRINAGTTERTIRRRFRNSTLAALPAPEMSVNRGGGALVAKGVLYGPGFTRTGGALSKATFTTGYNQDMDDVAGSIVLRPGESMSWTTVAPGAAANGTYMLAMEVVWWELPATA